PGGPAAGAAGPPPAAPAGVEAPLSGSGADAPRPVEDQESRVVLWDVRARRRLRDLPEDQPASKTEKVRPRPISCLAFSRDGSMLAAAGDDRRIFIWDLRSGRLIWVAVGHYAAVVALAFSPDGVVLASGSEDRTVKLWNIGLQQEVATLTGYQRFITTVGFSEDGDTLAVGSNDGSVTLLHAAPMDQIRSVHR